MSIAMSPFSFPLLFLQMPMWLFWLVFIFYFLWMVNYLLNTVNVQFSLGDILGFQPQMIVWYIYDLYFIDWSLWYCSVILVWSGISFFYHLFDEVLGWCLYLHHMYITLPQVFFKRFASKKQLPGLSISETFVENELIT